MQISLRGLEELDKKMTSLKTTAKKAKEKAEGAIQTVVGIAEVNSMAFSFGVINGRWGNPELLGLPVDLGIGLALHGAAFFDVAPSHMHNLGNGCTASYFSALGVGVGRKMLAEQQAAAAKLAAAAAQQPGG
jgi:hypothetical protein